MKKIFILILSSLILFSSTSCVTLKPADDDTEIIDTDNNDTETEGTTSAETDEKAENSDASETEIDYENTDLNFVLATSFSQECEHKDDNGVVLLQEKYELPKLELRSSDGTVYDSEKNAASIPQADICRAFNEGMQNAIDAFEKTVEEELVYAKENYSSLETDEQRSEWLNYVEELTVSNIYQTDTLISIECSGYASLGGTHPTSYTDVFNFDLTTGEFFTLSSLIGENNPLGQILYRNLINYVSDEINTQNLSDSYYEDYYSYISNMSDYAEIYFDESGMNILFDTYVIAPYAIGPQLFKIAYEDFYFTLSEHMQSLFALDESTSIVSDYKTTQILWSWFYMSMPPAFEDEETITSDDGYQICRANLGGINTLSELRSFLCSHVSEDVADKWLAEIRFYEIDGVLYTTFGARGSDITIGKTEYNVEFNEDKSGGTLTQIVYRQDFDESTNEFVLSGETEEYLYPFTISDGHAVFSDFPCPF